MQTDKTMTLEEKSEFYMKYLFTLLELLWSKARSILELSNKKYMLSVFTFTADWLKDILWWSWYGLLDEYFQMPFDSKLIQNHAFFFLNHIVKSILLKIKPPWNHNAWRSCKGYGMRFLVKYSWQGLALFEWWSIYFSISVMPIHMVKSK